MKIIALSLFFALPFLAHAAEPPAYAYVSALQPPAWVEQNGQRTALSVSDAIIPGRHYSTGANGRLQIAMADGSVLKLGENAAFEFPALQLEQDSTDPVLKGALKIHRGAFRYTAQVSNFIHKRAFDIYLGSDMSIGLGNPDLWGKADDSQDITCLLRGKIKVTTPGQPVQAMEQANTFYVVPHGQPPVPVAPARAEQITPWIQQTELANNVPALQSTGDYSVLLAVYLDEAHARAILADINQKGYPAILRTEKRDTTPVYDVIIEGLSSAQSAAAYADDLKKPLYVKNPRVLAPG